MYGFVITRHVNSPTTNLYWIECLKCIRIHYPTHPIMIVDDNSNSEFLVTDGIDMTNVTTIQSEYPGRGELLSYYYYYKLKPFDKAIVIHDSIFIQKHINFETTDQVTFLWNFEHTWDTPNGEVELIRNLKDTDKLYDLHVSHDKWLGCFGVMSVIDYAFLSKIQDKYGIFNLLNCVTYRGARCHLERVFALLCYAEVDTVRSLFGNVHNYLDTGYSFEAYNKRTNNHIVKVFTGR